MRRIILLLAFCASYAATHSQTNYASAFGLAYQLYPEVPRGILEAVSYTQTRFFNLENEGVESCSGMPKARGIMGMMSEGKSYFRENAVLVATLTGHSIEYLYSTPQNEVLAYASAWSQISTQVYSSDGFSLSDYRNWFITLEKLSFIPDTGYVNRFALDAERYEIMKFLGDPQKQLQFSFPDHHIQPSVLFGAANLQLLGASRVDFSSSGISAGGVSYSTQSSLKSTQYGPAIWNPAPTCNYSSRNGTAISAITIHTVQGTYAGAISWAQNCSSSVSYHYVVRSSDGQITQMVDEADKAWHVGSENPYTIGYEHEGYISESQWYTTALYTASASLSRDICNSGYGILPLRTFSGPATSGSNVLGTCIKIKGHQHYPNQTHTDPGIYWNWELYYELVNNNPVTTTNTSASGTLYDSGGSTGPYANDERNLTLIEPSGATTVTLNFTSFDTEANWDYLYIYDGATTSSPLIGSYTGTNSPGTVTSTGNALLLEFRSDCSTTAAGWTANWTSNNATTSNPDVTVPTTAVSAPGSWITQNFTATFTDSDNPGGSGIQKSYYQVIDYNGAEWRGNADNGFFSDNFDLPAISPEWIISTGNWALSGGNLVQSDESNGNTNVYASINHSLSNRYLYHWAGAIGGSGTNRRAGLHYFCSDPTLPNRGNSYFVYFRVDNATVQIYKVTNDSYTLMDQQSFTFNADQWYDFKVIYDRISGKHQVYVDNQLVQTWTDPSPLASGNYFSLRSGNCTWSVNNMKIFRSRAQSSIVTTGANGDIRYQSPNPSTQSGRIKSIVQDSADNLSAIVNSDVFVDWTPPAEVVTVNDGSSSDIATTSSTTILEANWTSSADTNSDIARYWYAIGTTAGGNDVTDWTDNAWNTSVQQTGLTLTVGSTYYVSVRAENGAGLLGVVTTSDGQMVVAPTSPPIASFTSANNYMCANGSIVFTNTSLDATSFTWTVLNTAIPSSNAVNASFQFPSSGIYTVQLIAFGPNTSDTLEQDFNVQVSPLNNADFVSSGDTVFLPGGLLTLTNTSSGANGYYWEFGDGTSSQDASPWHIYDQEGDYTVVLVAANDACPNDTATTLVHVLYPPLGLPDKNLLPSKVFPNPASDAIVIQFAENIVSYEIVDLNGKTIVPERRLKTATEFVNISNWAAGSYFVHCVSAAGQTASEQFIKR